jgi:hypothetical protein
MNIALCSRNRSSSIFKRFAWGIFGLLAALAFHVSANAVEIVLNLNHPAYLKGDMKEKTYGYNAVAVDLVYGWTHQWTIRLTDKSREGSDGDGRGSARDATSLSTPSYEVSFRDKQPKGSVCVEFTLYHSPRNLQDLGTKIKSVKKCL